MPSDKDIWVVLQKIKKLSRIPADQLVRYPLEYVHAKGKNIMDPAIEGSALYQLEDEGAFQIYDNETVKEDVGTKEGKREQITKIFYLRILPKFEEIYNEYWARFSGEFKKSETSIFLTPQGELFRYEGDGRLSYPMREDSIRRKIIDMLIDCTGYVQTTDMAKAAHTSDVNVRKAVADIRKQVEKRLHIDGKEFIQGKTGSGYTLGYDIKRVKR